MFLRGFAETRCYVRIRTTIVLFAYNNIFTMMRTFRGMNSTFFIKNKNTILNLEKIFSLK